MNWHVLENYIHSELDSKLDFGRNRFVLRGEKEIFIDDQVRLCVTDEEELDLLDAGKADELLDRRWSFSDIALFEWIWVPDALEARTSLRLLDIGDDLRYLWKSSNMEGSAVVAAFNPKDDRDLISYLIFEALCDNDRGLSLLFSFGLPGRIINYRPDIIAKSDFWIGLDSWLRRVESWFNGISDVCPYLNLIKAGKDPTYARDYPELNALGQLIARSSGRIDLRETAEKWKEYGLDKIRKLYLDINFPGMYSEVKMVD